jgi:penicillin-binding protein 2
MHCCLKSSKKFEITIIKIIIALFFIAAIFVARLAYLQLFTDRYALNAANTSIKAEYIIPQRGVIFDRNGKILVGNQPSYEVSFTEALLRPDFDTLAFCNLLEFPKRISSIESKPFRKKNTILN